MRKEKRKINKVKIVILFFVVFLLMTITVFGRYIYNSIRDRYLTSRSFYFTSNLLTINKPTYDYSNWGGRDTTEINLDLYSYENELLKMDYDLEYSLSCTPYPSVDRSRIICGIGKDWSTEISNRNNSY